MARSRDRSARADTEHRLESYTRNLPGAVWRRLLTPDGRLLYTYLSSGVKRLTEVDPTQAVIDSGLLQGVLHPDDRDGVLDSIHRSARDLTDWAREFRIVSKSGSVRWVHASGKVQGLEDGTVAWDGITLDVTDRKRSEQALRESEARFRSAFNQAAEGMGLISPEGRWLRVNRSLATLLGAPPEHIAGTSVVLWLAPRDRPVFQDLLRRATEDGGAVLDGEVRVRPAGSGPWARYDSASTDPIDAVDDPGEGDPADDDTAPESHVWIRTKAAPVRDENGALRHWVAHVQDVSARRATEALLVRARDQAEATARAKSDFVAMMSHEIRTPLSGMIGLARLLQDGSLSADQARNVGRIETSARLLLTLLDDVLALSKAEAGQGAAELAPVSPAAVISEVLGLLMANAAGKGLTLTMDVDPALPARLTGPRLVMRQVLFNLVGNAVKFTPAGAVTVGARLETTPHGATVLDLTVTDTGPGVRAEDRARIFDPFSQGGPGAVGEVVGVRGRRPGGVGLGLAICRRLVEGVGGRIAVEDAVGGGALFRVTLPVDTTVPAVRRGIRADDADETGAQDDDGDDDGEDDRDEAGETAGGQGRPARCPIVLVVDDDDINREVLEATLAALDCVPRGFTGGVDLLAAARAWPPTAAAPDLILMDLNMPDPDGVRTTRRLRDLGGAWARVPVLAVTAAAGRHPPEACTRAGMADCLFKPVEAATLARVLTAWVPGMAAPGAGAPDTPNAAPDAAPEAVPPLLDESVWARRLALLGRARLTDRVRDLRDLSAAVRAGDSEATHAHRLAGAAATLGARRLAAAAWTLERAVSRTLAGPDVETSPAPPAARAALRAARDATLAALDARLSPEP
nr:ATP-binding protein [Roseospira visakhapatnamensis]